MSVLHSYRFGSWRLDARDRLLYKEGELVLLPPKVIDTLMILAASGGRVLTKEEMMKQLWPDTFVEEGTLTQYISLVRKSLGDGGTWIENLPRRGYRFTAPVEEVAGETIELRTEEEARTRTLAEREVIEDGPPLRTGQGWRPRYLWVAVAVSLAVAAFLWLGRSEYFWRSPIAEARFQTVTDFDGIEEAAAISRDGQFIAFLSDRDGQMNLWVTQTGSGRFQNLTKGSAKTLVNRDLRSLGFSPDGSLVTYWLRGPGGEVGIWAIPTLGGQPRPYLEGAAEFDWSPDGSQLVFHTPGPGDPLYVSDGRAGAAGTNIFTAATGFHSHFPIWPPDAAFIYMSQGSLPDRLNIWRILPSGRGLEQITTHEGRVTHPVLLDRRTLLYLAGDPDGSGPWLYGMDVDRRKPHRLASGTERYTSLAASADGRRLVLTRASSKRTLWRLPLPSAPSGMGAATRVSLTTNTGYFPRLGPNSLLYVSAAGSGDSIWKLADGSSTELWRGTGARILGGPAISPDGGSIAFPVEVQDRTLLYVMKYDGTAARVVAGSLKLQGAPAWAPDGKSITMAGVDQNGVPRLFKAPTDGGVPSPLVSEYSVDAAWAPHGRFAVFSGPDVGTVFAVKAVAMGGGPYPVPKLILSRGARRLVFLPGGEELVYLRGDLHHKNLWRLNLKTGEERPLTTLPADFEIRDFDISPDGREAVLERVQEHSDVVLLDLARR